MKRIFVQNVGRGLDSEGFSETLGKGLSSFLTDSGYSITNAKTHKGQKMGTFTLEPLENSSGDPPGDDAVVADVSGSFPQWNVRMDVPRRRIKESPPTKAKTIIEAIAPLHDLSYDEQIAKKSESISRLFRLTLRRNVVKANKKLSKASTRKSPVIDAPYVMITVDDFIPSPATSQYRNKTEFTCGVRPSTGSSISVGFRIGSYVEGSKHHVVGELTDDQLCVVPESTLKYARVVESFLRRNRQTPRNLQDDSLGMWRGITVRESLVTKDSLVTCRTCPEIDVDVVERLRVELGLDRIGVERVARGTSTSAGTSDRTVEMLPNKGEDPSYVERLRGKDFRVSFDAFFQINVPAAEKLFEYVEKIVSSSEKKKNKRILLDVCCGTGVIGTICREKFDVVVGVDTIESSIRDAKINDPSSHWLAGKAEEILPALFAAHQPRNFYRERAKAEKIANGEMQDVPEHPDVVEARNVVEKTLASDPNCEIVAIVDPPRSGLHNKVLQTLRNTIRIDSIVYVSCNPYGSFVKDFVALARASTKKAPGPPFVAVRGCGIDMFPHTDHVESVCYMTRANTEVAEANTEVAEAEANTEEAEAEANTNKRRRTEEESNERPPFSTTRSI